MSSIASVTDSSTDGHVPLFATYNTTPLLASPLCFTSISSRSVFQAEARWHRVLGCRPRSAQELPSVRLGLSLEPNLGPPAGTSILAEGTVDVSTWTCCCHIVTYAGGPEGFWRECLTNMPNRLGHGRVVGM